MVHLQTFLGENLGDGKEKAVEFQSLCFVVGIGYCARFCSLRLTPFPSARRRGLNKESSQFLWNGIGYFASIACSVTPFPSARRGSLNKESQLKGYALFVLEHLLLQINLRIDALKQKKVSSDTFLLTFFVVDRGFEPLCRA